MEVVAKKVHGKSAVSLRKLMEPLIWQEMYLNGLETGLGIIQKTTRKIQVDLLRAPIAFTAVQDGFTKVGITMVPIGA